MLAVVRNFGPSSLYDDDVPSEQGTHACRISSTAQAKRVHRPTLTQPGASLPNSLTTMLQPCSHTSLAQSVLHKARACWHPPHLLHEASEVLFNVDGKVLDVLLK